MVDSVSKALASAPLLTEGPRWLPKQMASSPGADTAKVPAYSPLTTDTTADVCIVGAGISGLTTAYLLTQVGKSVVVLDDGAIGSGQTGATTAHLVNALDDRFFDLERFHGERGSRLAAESHTAAIDRVESIVSRERIACDFERLDGYLFCAPEHDEAFLDRELAAAHRAGLHNVVKIGRAPMTFDTGACLRFPNQAQFHPLNTWRVSPARSSAPAAASMPAHMPRISRAARTRPSRPKAAPSAPAASSWRPTRRSTTSSSCTRNRRRT